MKFVTLAFSAVTEVVLTCLLLSCVWAWHLVPLGAPVVSLATLWVSFYTLRVLFVGKQATQKEIEQRLVENKPMSWEYIVYSVAYSLVPKLITLALAWFFAN